MKKQEGKIEEKKTTTTLSKNEKENKHYEKYEKVVGAGSEVKEEDTISGGLRA